MARGPFVLTFESERDFVRVASVLLGTAYVSGADAVAALNAMPASSSFGRIGANRLQPVGKVGEAPVLGGGIGYLDVPLPLDAVLYAEHG